MYFNPFKTIIWLSIIILISGCDSRFKAELLLSEYLQDLNRSQLIELEDPAIVMPTGLPPTRNRQNALSTFDVSLLDFLSLQRCDIGIVAGRKNSILGRVMPDSQRFLYEIDIVRAIESCPIADPALERELMLVAQQKRIELPKAFGNAIFNGEESEAFFSLSNGFLPLNYSTAKQQSLLNALIRFVKIGNTLDALPVIQGGVFEQDLKRLMDSEFAGRLLFSLVYVRGYLDQVTTQVVQLSKKDCGAPVNYLRQQFETHYVKQIQPYMGRLSQSAYQVLPLLNELAQWSHLTPEMQAFMMQYDMTSSQSEWQQYQMASQRHAKAWSALFHMCGIGVGGQS
ncbi:DUF3080 family protein [Marinomonas sp. TW1]|uniref:DUF3080 family protein n=1 Tax=Marinomonas sp. TW1 TaxID=1561203 RepID=UPI0007AF2953|nr:DUF3080 family protein [Marinomonas sp. TW1]KZN13532.1 hypothetical protein OA79_10910 [Marinomonas sp. TW1]